MASCPAKAKYVPPSMRSRQQGEQPASPSAGMKASPDSPSPGNGLAALHDGPLSLQASVKTCKMLSFEGLSVACAVQVLDVKLSDQTPAVLARLTATVALPLKIDDVPENVAGLFHWFLLESTRADANALLEFDRSLPRECRAQLLVVAKASGLGGCLQGFGVDRYLCVFNPAGAGIKAIGTGPSLSVQQRQEAEQIWSWAKTEGSDMAQMCRADIQEMVASGNLTDEIQILVKRHRAADQLCLAAAQCDLAAVDEILETDKTLLHVTSREKNELALHAACLAKGSGKTTAAGMVQHLLENGARVNEIDYQGRSALAICKQEGGVGDGIGAVMAVLEQHGGREIGMLGRDRQGKSSAFQGRGLAPASPAAGGRPSEALALGHDAPAAGQYASASDSHAVGSPSWRGGGAPSPAGASEGGGWGRAQGGEVSRGGATWGGKVGSGRGDRRGGLGADWRAPAGVSLESGGARTGAMDSPSRENELARMRGLAIDRFRLSSSPVPRPAPARPFFHCLLFCSLSLFLSIIKPVFPCRAPLSHAIPTHGLLFDDFDPWIKSDRGVRSFTLLLTVILVCCSAVQAAGKSARYILLIFGLLWKAAGLAF